MKKKIKFLAIALLFVLGLGSCTNGKSNNNENNDNNTNSDNENNGNNTEGEAGGNVDTPNEPQKPSTGGDISASNPDWDNVNSSDSIDILEAKGHLESAYVKWTGVKNAVGYNVYYKEENETEFTKLDDMLIRLYPSYLRADAVGLKAGSYTLKIAPVLESGEANDCASANVTVAGHDRSGFAFSNASTLKDASGAYNSDGTLKENAQVIYVTKDNAKSVTATVNGEVQTGFQTILDAKQKKNTTNDILCFRLIGMISKSDLDHISSSSEGLQIKGRAANTNMNITIEGIGDDATVNGFGFLIRNCANVEIRNLGIINFMDDGISIDTDNSNLWLHNNDFFYGGAGGDADQAKGDGSLDIKKSHYITVSFNHFWDSGKCCLLDAGTGEGSNYITYHHNWFDHSDSRHVRVRNASAVHIYNNYYDGVAKYGIGAAGGGSSIFSEANYFRNTKYPMLTSLQGNDVAGENEGTFSGEDGGVIKSYGDVMIGGTFTPYSTTNTVEYDAYVASTRNEVVPANVVSKSGGFSYSNFDTDSSMYEYSIQKAEDAKATVEAYAGRISGGDLRYDFDDSIEDTNFEIITELKTMVVNYKSTLVKVLGYTSSSSNNSSNTDTNTGGNTNESGSDNTLGSTIDGAVVHDFTASGKESSVFTINGNLSTSKGSTTYEGKTLTQCLKIESSTSITFTTTAKMTLILVIDAGSTKKIKVDEEKYQASSGVITLELEAGTHTIAKADSINLFYIVLNPSE